MGNEGVCAGPQCDREVKSRGLCATHYVQQRRGITLKPIRKIGRVGCLHEGCEYPHSAHGYCSTHVKQFQKHGKTFDSGDLHLITKGGGVTIEDYFYARVEKTDTCWNWTGLIKLEYGYSTRDSKPKAAHRVSWEIHHGGIPEGMFVDHVCHNRKCVNPEHLRLVTPAQNNQNRKGAQRVSRTGIRGVTPTKNGTRFWASAYIAGKRTYLGTFDTAEEAGEVARQARLANFTHNDVDRGTNIVP